MLLDIVALSGDVCRHDVARRQLYTSNLALTGVGLLRSHDAHTEADAFLGRAVRRSKGGGDGVACSLALARAAKDLVEGRGPWERRGKAAEGRELLGRRGRRSEGGGGQIGG